MGPNARGAPMLVGLPGKCPVGPCVKTVLNICSTKNINIVISALTSKEVQDLKNINFRVFYVIQHRGLVSKMYVIFIYNQYLHN